MKDWWIDEQGTSVSRRSASIAEAKLRLPDLLAYHGLDIREYKPGWFSVRCPFHDDSNASASLNLDEYRFRCHGCDVSGDTIDIIEKVQGLDKKGALRWIQQITTQR